MIKIITNSLRVLAIAAPLLFSAMAFGQEFIKEPQIKCTTSLVREVAFHEWLAYSYENGMSMFALVDEAGSSAPTLQLPLYYCVTEFEIYNDTVYFCGYVDSTNQIALFGYFSIASFPYSTVFCSRHPLLLDFKKLEVFENNNKPHIVLTGTLDKYHSIMADALESTPNSWDFFVAYYMDQDGIVYDDVAVTNDYIVVTSRISDLDSGLIHYFDKPPVYQTMFPYSILFHPVQYKTTTPILVTACEENNIATLCMDSPTSFVMSKYAPYYNLISLRSTLVKGGCRDINFNDNSMNVEVLVFDELVKNGASFALHYDAALTGSALIPAHRWDKQILFSMDYLANEPNLFIATGREEYSVLRLYRYKYDEWHECPQEVEIDAQRIDNLRESLPRDYSPLWDSEEALPIECMVGEVTVNTICEN